MTIRLGRILAVAVVLASPAGVRAQGGRSDNQRADAAVERRERADSLKVPAGVAAAPRTGTIATPVRFSPSLRSSDSALTAGVGGQFIYDTSDTAADGRWYTAIRPSYKTARSLEARTHTPGAGIGADVQLNRNSDVFGQFIASADYARLKDRYSVRSAGLEWDVPLRSSGITAIATASVVRLAPQSGTAVSDVVPAVSLDYKPPTVAAVRFSVEYTFKNDVDEEDDYAVSARIGLGARSALRLGTGKHGVVFVSLTQTLDH